MEDSNDAENLANENNFESDEDDMEENQREVADDLNLYDFGTMYRCTSKLTVWRQDKDVKILTNFMRNFGSILRKLTMVFLVDDAVFVGSGYDYYNLCYGMIVDEDLHA